MKLPREWFDLDGALERGTIELVASKKQLKFFLVLSYAAALTTFGGLCAYYYSGVVPELVVSDDYQLPGYACRPLQADPQYKLRISYDECMSTYYEAPSVDNLLTYGHYGPILKGFDQSSTYDFSQTSSLYSCDGPWNESETAFDNYLLDGPLPSADRDRFMVYHKPLPSLSDVVYTVNDFCRVPYYDGWENHPKYTDAALDDLLRYPIERAALSRSGIGYGYYGLTNVDLQLPTTHDNWDFPDTFENVFKLATGTNFISQCGGNFSATFQSRVDADGTYVFPAGFSSHQSIWHDIGGGWDSQTGTYKHGNTTSLVMREGSIAMTPLYPINAKGLSVFDYTSFIGQTSSDTYFGTPRCEYYEKETSRQAYEYVYGKADCHPCDGFKHNSPFICERNVRKSTAEIIALATSNCMAVLAAFIAASPVLLKLYEVRKQKLSGASTKELAPSAVTN